MRKIAFSAGVSAFALALVSCTVSVTPPAGNTPTAPQATSPSTAAPSAPKAPSGDAAAPSAEPEFTFKVHNNTRSRIVKLLASEDGKSYGTFDIGAGISPGEKADLTWDKSTNHSNCEWYFKAVYDDGGESDPSVIDFCEDALEVEFSE